MITISIKRNVEILFEIHKTEMMTCYQLFNYMQVLPGLTLVKVRCALKELHDEKKLVRVGRRLEVMGGYCWLYKKPTQTKKYNLKKALDSIRLKNNASFCKHWKFEEFVLVYAIFLFIMFLLAFFIKK
jgi:hypothetical protein